MDNRVIAMAALGVAAVFAAYYALQTTDKPVPDNQTESQMLGLGAQAAFRVGAGSMLDMRPEIHFWNPGDYGEDIQPVTTPHRYPTVPGGNLSTVMHQGMSSLNDCAPGNNWFTIPPAAAVL